MFRSATSAPRRFGSDLRTSHTGPRRVNGRIMRPDTRKRLTTCSRLKKVLAFDGASTHDSQLVLSHYDPGRLLTLYRRLEALHDDEGWRRHGNAEPGAASIKARPGSCRSSASIAVRQQAVLHLSRAGGIAGRAQHRSCPRRAVSSANTGQDRALASDAQKNRILLENYYFPDDLEAKIAAFVERYNHRRYHESLNNLTSVDVYSGRGPKNPHAQKKDQTCPNPKSTLATPMTAA